MNPFESLKSEFIQAFPQLTAEDIQFTAPPNPAMGDIAVPMFLPAKKLGAPPPKLAADAAQKLGASPGVREAKPAGPYLNLRLDRAPFASAIVHEVLERNTDYGSGNTGAGKRAIIEHTSINPNASPHVGRARCAMIGDSVSRLFRFEGYDLEVHYYVNDMGRQIGLLVLIADELKGLTFDEVLDAYVSANARAEEDPEFAKAGYELLVKMEEGDPDAQARFNAVTDLCLAGQLEVLRRVGAEYDVFDRESSYLNDPRLEPVIENLRKTGALFTDDEQRLVVDLQKLGYPHDEGRFFVLRRANGSSMYGYRDLAYTIDKQSHAADANIIVLGEDHKLYFQQIALILSAAGVSVPEPIYYSYILLKSGKMSTRQGKVVLLSEFLDEAAARAAEKVAEQCHDITQEEQQTIAEQVAVAAIRFGVLRVSANKNVTFDMEAALAFSGDTGPYIQYCCARINSILRKYDGPLPDRDPGQFPLETDPEWALALKIADFPGTIASAIAGRTCAPIANYALELARAFTTFYHECPVLNAPNPQLIQARLLLCRATLQTLRNALHLLGIQAPDRM